MTQYSTLNVTLSNLELNELKFGIKSGTEVTLKFSSNVVGDFNDDTNFPHKLFLTDTQVSWLRKPFTNGSWANIKLSKTYLPKTGQSRGFLGRPLGPLLKTGLTLMKNVYRPLAKSVLIPLLLTATASATDTTIEKKTFGWGMTTQITSNEKINDIIKIVNLLENLAYY